MKRLLLISQPKHDAIAQAVHTLQNGGVVVIPTDTVYVFAVDATSDDAIETLVALKSRPPGKPISVFLPSIEDAHAYVKISSSQSVLLKKLFPGPYTAVLESRHQTSGAIESERGTLGIRVIGHAFVQHLVQAFGKPITATSANVTGDSPHYSIDTLLRSLSEKKKALIDLVIDAGKLPRNLPSTVIDLTAGDITILRGGDHIPEDAQTYLSHSEAETKSIAKQILMKHLPVLRKKALVLLLYGDLGTGKTIFVKGIGEYLGINSIISPTFVIFYEYVIQKDQVKTLYHFDLYRLKDTEELYDLHIEDALKPGNVICVEWSEKSGAILNLLTRRAQVLYVTISHTSETHRNISVHL